MTDPREARLPKWAQEELGRLRRRLDMAERRAAELRGEITDTDTRVNNYGDDDQPLPKGARIRFELLPDTGSIRRSIQVHAEGGELVIQGDYSVEIMPHSSNYFSVRMRR